MDSAIDLREVTRAFGRIVAVDHLTLSVERGEVVGFIGPNGAGKTTTIRMILDYVRPTSGTIRVLGLDARADAVEVHRRLGHLPGELTVPDRMTAERLIRWFADLRDLEPAAGFALAERLGLDTARPMRDLSAGNRQKVGLVQAFMHRPDVLLLDEPTKGLDPVMQREFRAMVSEAREAGATFFVSSHVLHEIDAICDRVAMIVEGRLHDTLATGQLARRRAIAVTVQGAPDLGAARAIPGVAAVDTTPTANGVRVELTVDGDIDAVVKWAAMHTVLDLSADGVGLDRVFLGRLSEAAA
ncbi:MAG: ABC transporter ATP-binding protein [Actinomycetota bacterium]